MDKRGLKKGQTNNLGGRPPLSEKGARSCRVAARLDPEVLEMLEALKKRGLSTSDILNHGIKKIFLDMFDNTK